jgi:hypothetical protein
MSDVPDDTEVDRIARLLMAEWARVEHVAVNTSFIATFADMARAVIADGASSRPRTWHVSPERIDALKIALRALARIAALQFAMAPLTTGAGPDQFVAQAVISAMLDEIAPDRRRP